MKMELNQQNDELKEKNDRIEQLQCQLDQKSPSKNKISATVGSQTEEVSSSYV